MRCLLCSAPCDDTSNLCSACAHDLPRNRRYCIICCEPLKTEGICAKCLKTPPKYCDRVFAPFLYQYPINKLIARLKFSRELTLAESLGRLLGLWLKKRLDMPGMPELIIPVPLHKSRIRQRGYNQSLLLAKPISRLLQIPLAYQRYGRNINTRAQPNLTAAERLRNVHNAFYCNLPLANKRVAIIDDVVTTGATTESFAKALRLAGATNIEVWAVARRALPGSPGSL